MEELLGTTPPAALLACPVLLTMRKDSTWLVLFPLKRLLASTPLMRKALEVSRWPLAQIGALPSPLLLPVPPESSALTPGERMASPVKLPVGSGTASICALSRTYPLVVSTVLSSGVASTVTDWLT